MVATFERDADWRPSAEKEDTVIHRGWIAAAVMLIAAATITMFRLLAGPSTLDRLVALDTLVAVTMCAIGTWAAFSLDTTVTYSLTALALISFVGSVSVARFRVPEPRSRRRRIPMNALDVVTAVLVLSGSALALTAAIGVVRFPDTLSRMHAATQAAGAGAAAGAGRRGDPAARPSRRRHDHPGRPVHPDHRTGRGQPRRPAGLSGTDRVATTSFQTMIANNPLPDPK